MLRLTNNIRKFTFAGGANKFQTHRKSYLIKFGAASVSGILAYDYIRNDFLYSKASLRFCRCLKTATLISNDYFWALRNSDPSEEELKELHLKSAHRLLETCLENGGLYIKIGQGVAAINHMLPDEYTKTLSQLQDKCLPESKENVRKLVTEELQSDPEEIFEEFDYNPVASASLAQVFKAKLKGGKEVAVKVQYQDLEKRFPSDLGTIIFIQNIVEYIFKDYNFGWILRSLQNNLIQEMNFINEAKNSETCAANLKRFKFIKVPEIYWELTSKRVLTMEWIDGVKVTDLENIKKMKLKFHDIDNKLFKAFADQIFNSGFVHADPHPGNIFVRKSASDGKAELVILDHGLYEKLPVEVREPLCEFWEATVLRDEEKMKSSAKELGIANEKNLAEVLFQTPFNLNGGGGVKTKLTDEDIEYMKEVGRKNFKLIMQTLKEMPKNMLFVIRNLNTIRAISREHGDPVDRPKVMARYAQGCLQSRYNSFFGFFHWAYRRIKFEIALIRQSLRLNLTKLYIDFLYKIGRSSETSEFIFNVS